METGNWKLLSWLRGLWKRLSSFHFPFSNFLTGLPWRLLLGGVVLVIAGLWFLEHDARLKQKLELQQQRRETSAEVAQLRARAETAMQEFRANAQAIESLEARRQALERDAAALRQKLSSLRQEENLRVQQLTSLAHVGTPRQTAPGLGPEEPVSGVGFQASGNSDGSEPPDTRHLTPRSPPAATNPPFRTS